MHLINTTTLELEYFQNSNEVSYGILSHRWEREEITHQEMLNGTAKSKWGYRKVERGCELARKQGLDYFWVDTCCIDKSSSAELSEAINSMFAWYRGAQVCFVYFSDVASVDDLEQSVWFTRGWTLQELLAPTALQFFSSEWVPLGTRADLSAKLSRITSIPPEALEGRQELWHWSVAQRLSWAAGRVTTRPEDRAYSLIGIFGINMPLLYGEGDRATLRLQEEILRQTDDHSIFAWHLKSGGNLGDWQSRESGNNDCDAVGLIAESIDAFAGCSQVKRREWSLDLSPFTMTNRGISVSLPIVRFSHSTYLALLNCTDSDESYPDSPLTVAIFLRELDLPNQYARTTLRGQDRFMVDSACWKDPNRDGRLQLIFDLLDAQKQVREGGPDKRTICRPSPAAPHELVELSQRNQTIFVRNNPMQLRRFRRQLFGFRIRRFTPYQKDSDLDVTTDCLVRSCNKWSWDERTAIMPDPGHGDVCRILVRSKTVKKTFEGALPKYVDPLNKEGSLTMPATILTFGFRGADTYNPSFACKDNPKDEIISPAMSDSLPDVESLLGARPKGLWSCSQGFPGSFSSSGNVGKRKFFFETEIVNGIETKVLDVIWVGEWSICDECGKAIGYWQYCCVSCSSPAYDCCTDCFAKISESKHDAKPGNEKHLFRPVRLTNLWGLKQVESDRFVPHQYKREDCMEYLS